MAIYVQVQLRSCTRDYLEQIQLVVRVGLELWIGGFQVRFPNNLAILSPHSDSKEFVIVMHCRHRELYCHHK